MTPQRLAEIEVRVKDGHYGTMWRACSDALLEVLAYARELEESRSAFQRQLSEAFNSGDGSYKP